MFCPKCGSNQSDELKFCKSCGTNLFAVRQVADTGQTGEKFDWSKTWLAEMLLSGEESVKRAAKIERLQGITPETKRRNEIKAGVITGSIGVGLMILLYVLMTGIILSGNVSAGVAEILSRVWVAGVIPIFVGLALIVNGVFVSKKTEKLHGHETDAGTGELNKPAENGYLPPAETNQLFSPGFSVTDETTEHLKERVQRKAKTPNAD